MPNLFGRSITLSGWWICAGQESQREVAYVHFDFTDLNKACPKDSYPFLRIDQLVDATAGHELLSFMDAFSGYNQIRMALEDEEKTAFITNQGLFYYKVMPFDLKNAGATYQHLVSKAFQNRLVETWKYMLMTCWSKVEWQKIM